MQLKRYIINLKIIYNKLKNKIIQRNKKVFLRHKHFFKFSLL